MNRVWQGRSRRRAPLWAQQQPDQFLQPFRDVNSIKTRSFSSAKKRISGWARVKQSCGLCSKAKARLAEQGQEIHGAEGLTAKRLRHSCLGYIAISSQKVAENLPFSSFQYMALQDHCVIATDRTHQGSSSEPWSQSCYGCTKKLGCLIFM